MKRAFTLVEAIAAIVIIALAAPPTLLLMRDASQTRRNIVYAERAIWLASAVMEHVIADVHSGAPGLGAGALDDADAYLNAHVTGLRDRIANFASLYESQGIAYVVAISALVSESAAATGNSDEDVFRIITVTASWSRPTPGDAEYTLSRLVTVR